MGYHTSEVAQIIGVSGSSVRRWSKDYQEFLSPTAQPQSGEGYYRRVYTRDDLILLWTIHTESRKGASADDILATLEAGELAKDLPPNLPLPENEPVQMIPASTAITQVKALQVHITYLEGEIERIREEYQKTDIEQTEKIASLENELGETKSELSNLRGRYEVQQTANSNERQLLYRTLVIVAIVAAALAVLLLIAITGSPG